MARLSGFGSGRIKSENGFRDNVWSDEQDCVPLKQRLKMLLASKRLSDLSDTDSEKGSGSPSTPRIDVVIKKEDQQCELQEERNWMSPEQSHADMLRDYSCQGTEGNVPMSSNGVNDVEVNASTVLLEKVDACSSNLTPCSVLSKCPVNAEVDKTANTSTIPLGNGVEGTLCTEPQAIKIKTQIADDFADDLDHVVLKERRRLLLSRKSLELTKLAMEVVQGNCSLLSDPVVGDAIQHSSGREKKESHYGDAESSVAGNHANDIPAKDASDFHKTLMPATSSSILAGSSCRILQGSSLMGSSQGTKSAKSGVTGIQDNDRICSSKKVSTTDETFGGQDFVSGNPHSTLRSALSSTFVNIKAETLDYIPVHRQEKETVCSFSNGIIPVKSEVEIPEASYGDKVDHMLLRDRIKLLASKETPNLDSSRFTSESAKPIRIIRPRKRRKTATDSVETALEEDAPGLLQVLIGKGVTVNEIKLYGEPESDEALDDSEDSFSELEAVISKLFSQRQSLLKFATLRCAKAEKASYCLACLISLVEQARYLQFRKWPVEWGWCRDLQSFIFVFERHNRVVLERPEYGYATYFFELVDSLPIHWQIKRLVTAMKLTSCSRVTLIENKPLTVGEDLTEGEARILTEYGWIPDSGLGTMLNYCDRVVHDRKNERDNSSDWRSKIGKLLMNGYNGGTIVSTDIPKKVIGYSGAQGPQIKLEL